MTVKKRGSIIYDEYPTLFYFYKFNPKISQQVSCC